MSARRNVQVVVIVLSLAALVSATAAEGGDKEKLAEGRYETVIQGKAEKGEYAEDWVLYRVPTGFLAEAEVHAQYSRERFAITNRYWLDSRMALMRWDMQLKDSPAEYRNELSTKVFSCELAPQEVRCWIGAESGTLRVSGPYGLVPVALPSSWFVVSWVRAARLQSGIDKARLKVVCMGHGRWG